MVQDLVIHIGDCKTGTTSIQSALAERAFTVQDRTFVYGARLNNNQLADGLRGPGDLSAAHEKWSKVAAELRASDADIAILSAENFEFVQPKRLEKAIKTHFPGFQGRLRIIGYVRPHAERLVSSFAERCKQGKFTGNLQDAHEQFRSTGLLNYKNRLDRWRAVFGEAYEVRPMIRSQLRGGDVVEDFLSFVFEDHAVTMGDSAGVNESLTLADLMALRRIHEGIKDSPVYTDERMRAVGWNLAALISTLPKPEGAQKLQLHRSLAEEVRQAYHEDAAAVDAAYFTDAPLTRALERSLETAIPEPQSLVLADHIDANGVRVIDGLALLLRRLLEADAKGFKASVRPEALRPRRAKGKPAGRQRAAAG